jgi:hypothetical protein
MAESTVSLNDLESIMKAAEVESKLLESENECCSQISGNNQSNASETPQVSSEDIKDALKNTNIAAMLNQMAANPDEVTKMMEESMNHMTPEMMEQARKLAMGGQGGQIMREMKKRGLNPKALKAQLAEQQKALRAVRVTTSTKQAILITHSKRARSRKLPHDNVSAAVGNILNCSEPVELSCSRLAQGPLAEKTIKVWYNPEATGKNRRASKIVGFSVGGEIIIVMEEGDLTEANFALAEQKLE